MEPIILGCPTYDGSLHSGAARNIYATACCYRPVIVFPNSGSLLNDNCNKLWSEALNNRQGTGAKWFAMLHADIEPEPYWLDKLIVEAEKHNVDFLSACIALKDNRGITSTAIATESDSLEQCGRLSFAQLWHDGFPETFDIYAAANALERLPGELRVPNCPRRALLCNTGCMVARIDRDWCYETNEYGRLIVCFDSFSEIRMRGGRWTNLTLSEDWLFSKRIADAGGKVMATRIVQANHIGNAKFPNGEAWGRTANDCTIDRSAIQATTAQL